MPDVARQFVAANGQYIYRNEALIPSFHAYTMAAWVYLLDVAAVTRSIFSLASSTSNNPYWKIFRFSDDTPYLSMRTDAGAEGSIGAMAALKTGAWRHVCGTCNDLGVLHMWMSGANMDTGGTAGAGWTLNRSAIGALLQASASEFWNGRIFWPAMWDVVLTDEEIGQLAAHARPDTIQVGSLISFPDFNDLSDTYAGSPWLNNGTTVVAPPPFIPYSTIGERLFIVGGERGNGLIVTNM